MPVADESHERRSRSLAAGFALGDSGSSYWRD